MLPTLRSGEMLLLRRTKRFRPGQLVLFEDAAFRLNIKRLADQLDSGWLVLGDNQANSIDSNTYGPIKTEQLKAVVVARYWPRPKIFSWRA